MASIVDFVSAFMSVHLSPSAGLRESTALSALQAVTEDKIMAEINIFFMIEIMMVTQKYVKPARAHFCHLKNDRRCVSCLLRLSARFSLNIGHHLGDMFRG